jgi:4,5-DOPA dioxygenase extradiol
MNFKKHIESLKRSEKMPVLFVGHGNPMNAIEQNEFTATWSEIGTKLPKPQTVLCISAHWETRGTHITAMSHPTTIHDFGGFPQELYEVKYPARGNPKLALEIKQHIDQTEITLNSTEWGLDHGTWSVVKHIYPQADVPVIQLSIDHYQSAHFHYQLAKELSFLRQKGVLIIGSGNMVHNLRNVNWNNPDSAYDWATEANEQMKNYISEKNHQPLIEFRKQGKAFDMAIPTAEHFIPLLYTLGLQNKTDNITFFNDKLMMGSLSMTGVLIG